MRKTYHFDPAIRRERNLSLFTTRVYSHSDAKRSFVSVRNDVRKNDEVLHFSLIPFPFSGEAGSRSAGLTSFYDVKCAKARLVVGSSRGEVSESTIRFRHPAYVFLFLERIALLGCRIEQFLRKLLGHRPSFFGACRANDPAHC